MTLTEFLLARIAEDEAWVRSAPEPDFNGPDEHYAALVEYAQHCPPPARVLAECEAKRRIVKWCLTDEGGFHWETALGPLAAVYADHPDYRDEWRL